MYGAFEGAMKSAHGCPCFDVDVQFMVVECSIHIASHLISLFEFNIYHSSCLGESCVAREEKVSRLGLAWNEEKTQKRFRRK